MSCGSFSRWVCAEGDGFGILQPPGRVVRVPVDRSEGSRPASTWIAGVVPRFPMLCASFLSPSRKADTTASVHATLHSSFVSLPRSKSGRNRGPSRLSCIRVRLRHAVPLSLDHREYILQRGRTHGHPSGSSRIASGLSEGFVRVKRREEKEGLMGTNRIEPNDACERWCATKAVRDGACARALDRMGDGNGAWKGRKDRTEARGTWRRARGRADGCERPWKRVRSADERGDAVSLVAAQSDGRTTHGACRRGS